MPIYKITFTGRLNGAIGILQNWTRLVDAKDFEQARIKLYDTHEHIHITEQEEVSK